MNHDAAHCLDCKKSCPRSCYRAKLTRELEAIDYPFPTSWVHFKRTRYCPLEVDDEKETLDHDPQGD